MSLVEKTILEDNVYRISVTLEKAELKTELTKKLKEYRKTAQWKGFRKGTAPLPFVKKMVGNQMFVELVEKMTSDALFGKIKEDDLNYIGQPIAAEGVPSPSVKLDADEDINFAFDVAVVPPFDVKESGDFEFDFFKVNNLDEVAKKEMEQAQISMGKDEETDAKFDDSATLSIKIAELDDKKEKEGGITNETVMRIAELDSDKLKKKLAKAKVGDSFIFAPFEDLSTKDEKYIASTYLGLQDDYEGELPQKFNAEIVSATHKIPAELNQEFFDGLFGPGMVDSEEKSIEKLAGFFEERYKNDANQMLLATWKKKLQEDNKVVLPSDYIKKVIAATNQGIDEEALAKDLPLIEKDLVWSTIRQKLLAKYEIEEASEHDIEHAIAHSIGSQYGIDPHHEIIRNIAKETMQKDRSKVEATFYGIMEGRLFDSIKDSFKTKDIELSDTEFADKVKEIFEA